MSATAIPSWLAGVATALDRRTSRLPIFFRDDDGGWADERLLALLDLFEAVRLPIDLAVIPAALTPSMAAALRLRVGCAPHRIGLHQHGYSHCNHASSGRKCEFGAERARADQRADIATGRQLLGQWFGDLPDPIFTPPWNRCTDTTREILQELGFRAISCDISARLTGSPALAALPVSVDWSRGAREDAGDGVRLGTALLEAVQGAGPVGIMLHHADLDMRSTAWLAECLAVFAAHPNVIPTLMRNALT